MTKLLVTKFLSTNQLLSSEKGKKLSEKIIELLETNESVEVDFDGYLSIGSSFINRAFGDTCIELNMLPDDFKEKVILINITEDDVDDIMLSVFNAVNKLRLIKAGKNLEEYYSSTLSY